MGLKHGRLALVGDSVHPHLATSRLRKLDPGSRSADASEDNSTIMAQTAPHTPPTVENDKADLQSPAATIENLNEMPSACNDSPSSIPVTPDVSSVSSIPL
jgi:hypothetical protein